MMKKLIAAAFGAACSFAAELTVDSKFNSVDASLPDNVNELDGVNFFCEHFVGDSVFDYKPLQNE